MKEKIDFIALQTAKMLADSTNYHMFLEIICSTDD